ncbi:hypothetical protein HMPREF9141_0172 [Prevotella multiformis DSM 16608]|uniref:Uncharacterized protein n=1 Tax=Prevotella multiformis DSM 16608 TaxID=888743 RepID=F0F3K6_9BACT|nr:hypothetical protein HMPREF9141_0172 [Prevotella multiformis DSM 16608]
MKQCKDFSDPCLYFQRIKMKRALYRRIIIGWTADVFAHVSVE